MKSFACIAAAAALLSATMLYSGGSAPNADRAIERTVDAGIFNAVYPIPYASHDVQQRAILDRLEKITALLESRDLSEMPMPLREMRERNIERLREYRSRGEFPVNYDYPGVHLPCFIDKSGAICAVGYLVERSAGRDVAEAINSEYKYATVGQMTSPTLDAWIATSGFSRAEIATIQEPAMFSEPVYLPDEKGNMVQTTIRGKDRQYQMPIDSAATATPVAAPEAPVIPDDAAPTVSPVIGEVMEAR